MINLTEAQEKEYVESVQADIDKQQSAMRETLRLQNETEKLTGRLTRFMRKRARIQDKQAQWRNFFFG